MADAVDGRVPQVDVGGGHVDLGAHDVGAIREFAGLHALEEVLVLGHGAVPVGAVLAGFRQGAPVGTHFLGVLAVHIGVAGGDQVLGGLDHPGEIVGGVVEVLLLGVFPVETQPLHCVHDGIHVFLVFLLRVGVIEAQVAAAAVVPGQAEIEADGLGVAEVQVAVGLRREAGANLGRVQGAGGVVAGQTGLASPVALGVLAGGQVGFDDVADEVGGRGGGGRILVGVAHSRFSLKGFGGYFNRGAGEKPP